MPIPTNKQEYYKYYRFKVTGRNVTDSSYVALGFPTITAQELLEESYEIEVSEGEDYDRFEDVEVSEVESYSYYEDEEVSDSDQYSHYENVEVAETDEYSFFEDMEVSENEDYDVQADILNTFGVEIK